VRTIPPVLSSSNEVKDLARAHSSHCHLARPRSGTEMYGTPDQCHLERSDSEVERSGWGMCNRNCKTNVAVAVTRFFTTFRMTLPLTVLPHSAVGGTCFWLDGAPAFSCRKRWDTHFAIHLKIKSGATCPTFFKISKQWLAIS
jgi:hypothetical protein